MSESIVFPEWLNSNSQRNYPIQENASRTDVSGAFVIPNSLVVAFQINYPRSYVGGTFYISTLTVSEDNVSIEISFQPSDTTVSPIQISTVTIEGSSFTQDSYYSFVGSGSNVSVLGSIGVGDISETISEGIGVFKFLPASTLFEANTQFVSVPALQSVEIYNPSNSLLYTATDVLKLKAGQNIRLTYEQLDSDPYGVIRIDAINGENLVETSTCNNALAFVPSPITQINGVSPDANGRIFLEGSDCIQITTDPATNSIQIIDTCSTSCCGCTQLEILTTALEQLRAQETTLAALISSTQGQQSEMLANLISNL